MILPDLLAVPYLNEINVRGGEIRAEGGVRAIAERDDHRVKTGEFFFQIGSLHLDVAVAADFEHLSFGQTDDAEGRELGHEHLAGLVFHVEGDTVAQFHDGDFAALVGEELGCFGCPRARRR